MDIVRSLGAVLLLLVGLPWEVGQESAIPTFVIERPTVIAFFPPMTDAELEKDPDMNDVLADFQLYASQAKPRLEKAGIDFEVASAAEFKVKNGGVIRDYKAGKEGVGYYFVAPGKEPHVELGVMTDLDILDVARRQFQLPIPGP